jgi:hypothetical protein
MDPFHTLYNNAALLFEIIQTLCFTPESVGPFPRGKVIREGVTRKEGEINVKSIGLARSTHFSA